MRILSVAAPGNGSGKTLTLAAILQAFPGRLTAVKFTTVYRDGVNCPRTEKACACRELHGDFRVVTDSKVLETEESDTGRLARAGARTVIWCLCRPGAHAEAWSHLQKIARHDGSDLLTEGNTILGTIEPDLLLFVMSPRLPRQRWKADTWALARRAAAVVLNSFEAPAGEVDALAAEVALHRGGSRPPIVDVSQPLAGWAGGALRDMVATTLGPAR